MQKTKQILALLAVSFLFFGTGSVFAKESSAGKTGSITVDNAQAGASYTAYKIFDASYVKDGDSQAWSYSIRTDSPWYAVCAAYAAEGRGVSLDASSGDASVMVASFTDNFSAADFAAYLKAAESGKTGTALTVSGSVASASGLDIGYYYVSTTSGAVCALTSTDPDSVIHDKNELVIEKHDDKGGAAADSAAGASVQIGEVITETITGKVPSTLGYTNYVYQIEETASSGLTMQKDASVTIGGKAVVLASASENAAGDSISYTDNGFVLSLDLTDDSFGDEIIITYSLKADADAPADVESDTAVLTYSDDPADSASSASAVMTTLVYTQRIVVDKYIDGNTASKLAGAEFVLYKLDGENKLYYKLSGDDVLWGEKAAADVKTTDNEGSAVFEGLKTGVYYLEEVKAPDGYSLLTSAKSVSVGTVCVPDGSTLYGVLKAESESENMREDLSTSVSVANVSRTALPATGAAGILGIVLAGGALMAGGMHKSKKQ